MEPEEGGSHGLKLRREHQAAASGRRGAGGGRGRGRMRPKTNAPVPRTASRSRRKQGRRHRRRAGPGRAAGGSRSWLLPRHRLRQRFWFRRRKGRLPRCAAGQLSRSSGPGWRLAPSPRRRVAASLPLAGRHGDGAQGTHGERQLGERPLRTPRRLLRRGRLRTDASTAVAAAADAADAAPADAEACRCPVAPAASGRIEWQASKVLAAPGMIRSCSTSSSRCACSICHRSPGPPAAPQPKVLAPPSARS